jgi:hypothetical protein
MTSNKYSMKIYLITNLMMLIFPTPRSSYIFYKPHCVCVHTHCKFENVYIL